jgi:hypothetical protein
MKWLGQQTRLSFFSVLFSLRQTLKVRLMEIFKLKTNVLSCMNRRCRKCGLEESLSSEGTRPVSNMNSNSHKMNLHLNLSYAMQAETQILTCRSPILPNKSKKCSLQHLLKVLKGTKLLQKGSRRVGTMQVVKIFLNRWQWVGIKALTKIPFLTFHTKLRKNKVGTKKN